MGKESQVPSQPTVTLKCPGFEDIKLPGYKGKLQSKPADRKPSITQIMESNMTTPAESRKMTRNSYQNRYLKMLTYTSNDTASDPAFIADAYSDNDKLDSEL